MLKSFALQLRIDCRDCGMHLPVNGIVESLACCHCGSKNKLSRRFWTESFKFDLLQTALERGPKSEWKDQQAGAGARIGYANRPPRCPNGHTIDPSVVPGMLGEGHGACPTCSSPVRVRAADDQARAIHPGARFVVAESVGAAPAGKGEAMVVHCQNCGAGLDVDGSTRKVECHYCNQSNYLPDEVWHRLHPAPEVTWFFMVCDYSEAALKVAALARNPDIASKQARRPDLPAEEYAGLAQYGKARIRTAVAGNPAAPVEVLALLAKDEDRDVVEALVENPKATGEVLETLSHNHAVSKSKRAALKQTIAASNPETRPEQLLKLAHDVARSHADLPRRLYEALQHNPALPLEGLEALAHSEREEARGAAAGHEKTPVELLQQLARDHNPTVKATAKRRLDELGVQEVAVRPKGLFAKLFGG